MLLFDTIWRSLVHDCLEFPAAYAILRRFLAQDSSSTTTSRYRQALCEHLAEELEEHTRNVLVPLDDAADDMTLAQLHQTLWQTIRPVLAAWVQAAATTTTTTAGQEQQQQQPRLVHLATAPYRHQLRDWIAHGRIPPQDDGRILLHHPTAPEWTEQFTWAAAPTNHHSMLLLDRVMLPCLADPGVSQQVLATGRYWHAVQRCRRRHREKQQPGAGDDEDDDDTTSSTSSAVLVCDLTPASIQAHYTRASRALMQILFRDDEERGLLHTLRLVKGFWLLEYGDLFLEFMHKAQQELLKDTGDVSRNRLQHWMNTCFPDDASPICRFAKDHWIIDQQPSRRGATPQQQRSSSKFTGIDVFYVDLPPVPFPVSLVLSPQAVEGYQQIFRHVFYVRFVKWRLVAVWRDHQDLKPLRGVQHLSPTFLLRQRMIHFLENILHYMLTEIIDPQWLKLQSILAKREELTVDDVCRVHGEFLETVLEACFLRHPALARSLMKIMKTCLLFADQMHRFRTATSVSPTPSPHHTNNNNTGTAAARQRLQHTNTARTEHHRVWGQRVAHEARSTSFQRMTARFEQVWTQQLSDFVRHMQTTTTTSQQPQLGHLSMRLDFNGYMTQSLLV